MMKRYLIFCWLLLSCALALGRQTAGQNQPSAKPPEDYSGMYSFLKDGEFVQITVEDQGRVTGFISRYGELDSDRGVFLDQFFKQGKLDGNKLSFSTQTVHETWYEFKGSVERGDGKNPGDEAYYVLKGTLTQYTVDANQKTSSKSREVTFKVFPRDMGSGPEKPEKRD
jgi:hypothetical protein